MKIYYEPEGTQKEITGAKEPEHTLQGHDIKAETKDQHAKMKDKPFKEKFAYYFGYYKFHVLGIVVVTAMIISIIHAIVTNKDYCFGAIIANSNNIDSTLLSEGFCEYASLDTKTYDCYIEANEAEALSTSGNPDYAVSTRFAAMISTSDLDVTIYDSIVFYRKALNSVFMDLTLALSPEDLARFNNKLYYIDGAEIEALENTDEEIDFDVKAAFSRGTLEEQWEDVKKHMDPSTMKKPIPVGIVIDESPMITTLDAYYEMVPVFGIITNTKRLDTAVDFLHYIYEDSVDWKQMQFYAY